MYGNPRINIQIVGYVNRGYKVADQVSCFIDTDEDLKTAKDKILEVIHKVESMRDKT
jgi:hypothetical protein